MEKITHCVGIDPGIVHTGVVRAVFDSRLKMITVTPKVFDGVNADEISHWVYEIENPVVFIEKYRPRHNYAADRFMIPAERELKYAIPRGTFVSNLGVHNIVTKAKLEMLDMWQFDTATHHQDLRSAARIMVFGMLKKPELNAVLADVTRDYLEGRAWKVQHSSHIKKIS